MVSTIAKATGHAMHANARRRRARRLLAFRTSSFRCPTHNCCVSLWTCPFRHPRRATRSRRSSSALLEAPCLLEVGTDAPAIRALAPRHSTLAARPRRPAHRPPSPASPRSGPPGPSRTTSCIAAHRPTKNSASTEGSHSSRHETVFMSRECGRRTRRPALLAQPARPSPGHSGRLRASRAVPGDLIKPVFSVTSRARTRLTSRAKERMLPGDRHVRDGVSVPGISLHGPPGLRYGANVGRREACRENCLSVV